MEHNQIHNLGIMNSKSAFTSCARRALFVALLLTGTWGISASAADIINAPITVTEKDTVINKDAEVTIKPGYNPFHVIEIDKSASKGKIQINSKNITTHLVEAQGPQIRIDGIVTNKGFVNKPLGIGSITTGYEGQVNFADGLKLTVDGTGTCPKIVGIYENGLQDISGDPTRWGINKGAPVNLTYNIGNNTTISLEGVDRSDSAPDLLSQGIYYVQMGIANAGGTMNIGDSLNVSNDVQGKYSLYSVGISNDKYGKLYIGKQATINASGSLSELSTGYGAEVYGLISRHDQPWDRSSSNRGQQEVTLGDNAKVNVDFNSSGTNHNSPASIMGTAVYLASTKFTAGNNLHLTTTQENSGIGTYGLFAWKNSHVTIGDGFEADMTAKGNGYGIYGVYGGDYRNDGPQEDGTDITFKGHVQENLNTAGGYQVFGNYFNTSSLNLQGNDDIQITTNGDFNHIVGTYMLHKNADLTGENSSLSVTMAVNGNSRIDPYSYEKTDNSHVDGLAVEDNASAALKNIFVNIKSKGTFMDKTQITGVSYRTGTAASAKDTDGTNISVTGNTNINVEAENTGSVGGQQLYGLHNEGGLLHIGDANIRVTGKLMGEVSGVHTTERGTTDIAGPADIFVSSDASNQTGISSSKGGQSVFHKGITIKGAKTAIESKNKDSLVDIIGAGAKVIEGNLLSSDSGVLRLSLHDGNSSLTGMSTVENATTNLTISQEAVWNMTGDSQVTHLELNRRGQINMRSNSAYETLTADHFSGQDGNLYMKTDLASELNGDKLVIMQADPGSSALIQVEDASLTNGRKVTGIKNLLLVTDKSKNAVFTGKSLDKGGLWDVTPTIQRGDTVKDSAGNTVGDATQWYLTKLAKIANADTKPLLGAVDYSYGLYRNSIDTLRQRMGDLRFLKNKRDAAGIWARSYSGELDGPGYDSKYHAIQVGYDYAANDKSLYGFLGERGIASPHYDYGHSKDHSLAGAIYGTWFGDSGSYTDVVAKWGRDDSNLHTYGPYADSANFRTSSESLSVEYGKTTKLNDHGLFIEPQAQLVLGRLNDKDFTTARGKIVHLGSYDSAIGRLGFVFGQRRPDAAKPYDYYLKASVLHEFGGDRSFHLAAPDGETMDLTNHYGSTWYEAGFGGTYRVNNSTYLYADAERSFGSDWHKKWQANVGINWQF